MNVNSVSNLPMQSLHKTPERSEAAARGPDGDGDTDDRAATAAATGKATTVNLAGQRLGQHVNVQA